MPPSLRWTLLMAILGFILGLGFLVPVPTTETRLPASSARETFTLIKPDWEPAPLPKAGESATASNPEIADSAPPVDRRTDTVFDIHIISRSGYVKGTDAYVQAVYVDSSRKKLRSFNYCHNYDFDKLEANPALNRYQIYGTPHSFQCFGLSLDLLASGYSVIRTPLGTYLKLKTQPGFDPAKGGIVSVIYAFHVAKIGANDYRRMDLQAKLENGVLKMTGPNGESFNWLNMKMTEDFLNLPNGVDSFETYLNGKQVGTHPGDKFRKTAL